MARRTAATEARAKTHQQSASDGQGPTRRHFWRRNRKTHDTACDGSENETRDERSAPDPVSSADVQARRENSADPAIRPLISMRRVAARPMRAPPTAAEIGVKFTIYASLTS